MPRCSNFANLLAKSDGYRVETPIGSFAPKLKLLGEHTDPKTIHGRDIEYAGIEFIPSKEFIKQGGKTARATARVMLRWEIARCTTRKQWTRPCGAVCGWAMQRFQSL